LTSPVFEHDSIIVGLVDVMSLNYGCGFDNNIDLDDATTGAFSLFFNEENVTILTMIVSLLE
jgi:hypothetical protein